MEDKNQEADAMIARGRKMKENAMKMTGGEMMDGMSKDELMMKSDKLILDGRAMKEHRAEK